MSKIICGDALTVLPNLPDESVDMIFTDPPFGVPIGCSVREGDRRLLAPTPAGLSEKRKWVPGDDRADEMFNAFSDEAARLLKPGACLCCCCCGGGPNVMFARWVLRLSQTAGLQFKQMVVWYKGMGMGWHYRFSYETVLVAQKLGAPCRWFDTSHKVENVIHHVRKVGHSKDKHPTEKPAALAAHFIGLHSQAGDTVLDPFCGHGSTGVAAVSMGRKFVGIELYPPFAQTAEQRVRQAEEKGTLNYV